MSSKQIYRLIGDAGIIGIVIGYDIEKNILAITPYTIGSVSWPAWSVYWGRETTYGSDRFYWAIPYKDGRIDMEIFDKFINEVFIDPIVPSTLLIKQLYWKFRWQPDPIFETIK